ncbi:LysR family transcriptional regulator [Litoreibacter halocynthiae]|uniref:LysR family transcriptional regulator n=1 Tax=Litoreibacter halocynthiae TaxID=1242689 RepID=UPI002493BDB9|nr:LysR family transcriptional regulator [Litoreibacter halocynthiae]
MHNSSWDNLRYVLSVIEAGSVSAAARDLGVNHATVLRRIAAFETQYGGVVFDKNANGYRLMEGKDTFVQAVREVESSVLTVERLMQGTNPTLSGVVRISSTDSICQYLLPDVLETLKEDSPQLEIELLSNNLHLNFARMEADLFVRPAMTLPEDMIAESVNQLIFRAYGTSENLDRWFGLKGPLAKSAAAEWMSENIPRAALGSGSDSFVVLSRMAQRGTGIAILPSFVGESIPNLKHLPSKMPDIAVPIWVGSHQDLRDIPRIRAVKRALVEHLSAES